MVAPMTPLDARSIAALYAVSDACGYRFEAKKDGLRQTQDGLWKLGLTVAGDDLPAAVMSAQPGTRFLVLCFPPPDESPAAAPSPPAEQAAIPRDRVEREPLPLPLHKSGYDRSERQKLSTEGERAVTRCAILCNDGLFQWWLDAADSDQAAERVRLRIGGSRSIIATDRKAFDAFIALETDYRAATGQQAERR